MDTSEITFRQHLIDPEVCIRCNTCEATCPVGAITHDARNYVVDPSLCNFCLACVPPCPTGAIDNWRTVLRERPYSVTEQFSWEALPAEENPKIEEEAAVSALSASSGGAFDFGETRGAPLAPLPPWSAAHPYVNLYGPRAPEPFIRARCVGNIRLTGAETDYETHHIVLDFGSRPFPVLEGQSIGILPPGLDEEGRPHLPRQYSVASPRNGERPGYNNLALTVRRVMTDRDGRPCPGVASNYLCDLEPGDEVRVIGPFGTTFLMPNHPGSHIVMICTGTGSAPMRAMTEWRRRLVKGGRFRSGRLLLFFGARRPEDLPYFGPLQNLPRDFIEIHLAFSRSPAHPRRYVQDALREASMSLAPLLTDPEAYFFVCGLRAMEKGVTEALAEIAAASGADPASLFAAMRREGRLHFETY
jgi:benzoyl-CoA 2,3-dioxygenase component A